MLCDMVTWPDISREWQTRDMTHVDVGVYSASLGSMDTCGQSV